MKKIALLFSLLILPLVSTAQVDIQLIKERLARAELHALDIKPSAFDGLMAVTTDNGIFYISQDGRYLLQAPMYDISGKVPVNVTNNMLIKLMKSYENEMIVYKAAREKHVVTVFTDITCGYCVKLHNEIKAYNDLGITIRYMAFPRQGLSSENAKQMKSVWCAADNKDAFEKAVKRVKVPAASCDVDIAKHYQLGGMFGVQGTPAILTEDGMLIPGYQPPKQLLMSLDAYRKATQQ